jgi:hypothetical protein
MVPVLMPAVLSLQVFQSVNLSRDKTAAILVAYLKAK